LVGVAVSTDYWLLMEEGIVLQQNQTTEVKMALHSGLWRVCFVAGEPKIIAVFSLFVPSPPTVIVNSVPALPYHSFCRLFMSLSLFLCLSFSLSCLLSLSLLLFRAREGEMVASDTSPSQKIEITTDKHSQYY
ncbi:hypothetical protein cypCar_00014094, partial [Cyprinus carpio]